MTLEDLRRLRWFLILEMIGCLVLMGVLIGMLIFTVYKFIVNPLWIFDLTSKMKTGVTTEREVLVSMWQFTYLQKDILLTDIISGLVVAFISVMVKRLWEKLFPNSKTVVIRLKHGKNRVSQLT